MLFSQSIFYFNQLSGLLEVEHGLLIRFHLALKSFKW